VDANFRAPSLPETFETTNHYGLTDALRCERPVREFVKQLQPQNLWLLSCGSAASGSVGLLTTERMRILVNELRKEFEYVLVDAPALNAYADGLVLGPLSDGVVLVLEANVTRREAALRVAERMRDMRLKVLGAVLNKRTFPIPKSIYHRI
jgi:Mrp family chromosome partitioning ATPase